MATPCFEVQGVRLERDGAHILRGVTFRIEAGTKTCILGPNGAGKSTLLAALSGTVPFDGEIRLFGEPIERLSTRDLARRLAFVRQEDRAVPGFSVRELVAMGRTPFLGGWHRLAPDDERLVDEALERTGLRQLADRSSETLSGGELRLVSFARALAQAPRVLLLDEPTAFLDLARERRLFALAGTLAREGTTVVSVVHDLHLDLSAVDHVLCLHAGELVAMGHPREVLTEDLLSDLYGVAVTKLPDAHGLRFMPA